MTLALWFHDHGVGVFPIITPGKAPACKSWDDYDCTRAQAVTFRNYGVRLGATLGVLDTDSGDTEQWVLRQIADRALVETPFVVTTARGSHRYYRLAGPRPAFIHRDGHTIEFRNRGQYVVGPGSVHTTGVVYTAAEWSWQWDDIPVFPPDFVWDDRPPTSAAASDGYVVPAVLEQSERHDGLYRIMRSLVARGVPLAGALAACQLENRTRCRPPLADLRELDTYLRRAYHQRDTAGFVRTPQTGWELAGGLVALGLSTDAVLVAVRSVTPDFNPEQA